MKSITESLNNSLICEGRINYMEIRTICICLGMIIEYRDMVKPETVKFVEDLFTEEELKDIVETLNYWDDNQCPKSYNVLYKQLYGDKLIKLCDWVLKFDSDMKASWKRIKTELEKIQTRNK